MSKNQTRAEYTNEALNISADALSDEGEEKLIDLLTNLRHWCDTKGLDFGHADRLAYEHYIAEVQDAED